MHDNKSIIQQPLRAVEAKQLARHIVDYGMVFFTKHAEQELAKDGKKTVDAVNVIRAGAYSEAEWDNGEWRHHASTQRFTVVVQFESDRQLLVITGWAKK